VGRDGVQVAERFYRALGTGDPRGLLDVLDPELRAEVMSGLLDATDSWRWHEVLETELGRR
jgi:hypothetical protein